MKSLDINKISEYINTYQRVILFDCNDSEIKKMYEKTRKYVDDNLIERVLVLSNFDFKEDKYIHFLGLYHTYEFSDRFIIILQNIGYSSMLNYLFQGILTEEEFIEALLH